MMGRLARPAPLLRPSDLLRALTGAAITGVVLYTLPWTLALLVRYAPVAP